MKKWVYVYYLFIFCLGNLFFVGTRIVNAKDVCDTESGVSYYCNNVKVYKWNTDWSGNEFKCEIGLKQGESVCTVDRGLNDASIFVALKAVCTSDGLKIKSADPYEEAFYCEDSFDNAGLRKADFINRKQCTWSYPAQNYSEQLVIFNDQWQLIGLNTDYTVCKDENTVGRCVMTGEIVPIQSCSSGQMCRIVSDGDSANGWGAECKTSTCTENGVTVENGKSGCIPDDPSKSYTTYKVKKCIIGTFNKGEQCDANCVNNGGAAQCTDKKICNGSDVNLPELGEMVQGSSNCTKVDGGTIWSCESDGLNEGKTCSGSKPYCYTKSENGSLVADCDATPAEDLTPEERATILNISISTDIGFMCTLSTGETGVSTAFGCVPITASGLASALLPILFGIAGGISFLRMIYGFILIATSSGDEKKFIEAKSVISSAIIGLLVSIFAIFLFRLIFVSILKIPGLS